MPLSSKIQEYVVQHTLTLEQAMGLNYAECTNLESEGIRGLITDGTLTIEQAMGLNYTERTNLQYEYIRGLITDETLTLEQAMGLNYAECTNLESEGIRGLITDGTLTIEQAMGLNYTERTNLKYEYIRGLITDETLTIEQAMGLNYTECTNLKYEYIRGLITDETLTLEQAMGLNYTERTNLQYEYIRGLITDETLTLEQAMGLTYNGRTALEDEHTRQRLRNGELTIQNIMGDQIPLGGPGIAAPVNLNDSQSTHTASVHRTVSESATRLLNRYPTIMDPQELNALIITITTEINNLPNDDNKSVAAQRYLTNLAAQGDYAYKDLASGVNTRELLALSWLAIHDDTMRTGSLEDATHQFIEGLYEIQRGYNLSETGVDLGGSDKRICAAGTFNKLLEKINGAHPDVVIEVITPKLATLKFPIVVKDEVKNYLSSMANPSTSSEFSQFNHQIKKIEEEGVEVIWDAIKNSVAARMFDEFGSLYANQDDPRFTAFIDAGKYVELGKLPSFQKEVSESEGCREYCSSTTQSYRTFSQNQCQNPESSLDDGDTNTPKPTP